MNRLKFVTILMTLVLLASVPVSAQRGRGRGRGAAPPVPQAMQDVANGIVEAINSHNEDALMAMLLEGALFLDEDGHALPAPAWVGRVTGENEGIEISGMRGQTWSNSGWVSFNYEFSEEYEGNPVTLTETASVVVEQAGGNWMIRMVHGALEQHVPAMVAAQQED